MSGPLRSRVREIGRYEVLQRLRSGGMATLYLARRRAPDPTELVAIKVIHDHLAESPEFHAMFEVEAQIQSRISHRNVVALEEIGTTETGEPFLVMEWIDGCSVAQLLTALHRDGRTLPIEVAVRIAMEVAAGLHAAHTLTDDEGAPLGVVHRDVSPDNILLARDGEVKLIDFGIAKARTGLRTMTGVLKGKVRYMSPEQARSQPIDRRTDVYALGVVLWEMLTTRRLFEEADQVLALEAVRRSAIVTPSVYRSELPAALDELVMATLSADPAARPATAEALREALARACPGALALDASAVTLALASAGLIEAPARLAPGRDTDVLDAPPDTGATGESSITRERVAPRPGERGEAWLEDESDVVDTNELPPAPAIDPAPPTVSTVSPAPSAVAASRPWLRWLLAALFVPIALWLAFSWVDEMESRRGVSALPRVPTATPSSPSSPPGPSAAEEASSPGSPLTQGATEALDPTTVDEPDRRSPSRVGASPRPQLPTKIQRTRPRPLTTEF